MNGECPGKLGGATVIAYAIIQPGNRHTGNTRQIVDGKETGPAKAMIIAQYEGEDAYYVLGCYSEEWEPGTDTWHQNLEDAIQQLDWEYEDLSKSLTWYIKNEPGA